jgi:hypothetical protein
MSKDKVEETATAEAEEAQTLTPEEIEKQREELKTFYDEEIPLLQKRAEYEELVTRIEEARFNRFQIKMAKAQIMAPQMGPDGMPEGEQRGETQPSRKLAEAE